MSIKINYRCYMCHFCKNVADARSYGDEETATAFAKDLMQLYLTAPEDASLTWFGGPTNDLFQKYYDVPEDRFLEEKKFSNDFALARLEEVRQRIRQEKDPVYAGLQYAILGNYIDFSALHGQVSFEMMEGLLEKAREYQVEEASYQALRHDLETGKKLLYITDNAGEIAFDRLFAEEIHRAYPGLDITFCVRGAPTANDALRADAAQVGIAFPVIDNGNNLAGTELTRLSPEAAEAIETADVIISKGQANVESLYGSGYNIYYAFLVKCQRFMDLFGKEKFTPMLVRERK